MHEASLMVGLMRRIDEVALSSGAKRVVGVSVRLGVLSHMSAEHFTEHFVQASAGTIAEAAELQIAVDDDPDDPRAQDILLESVEIET
jgi:hydrogenase nickel incorporation protein HypA/HybF